MEREGDYIYIYVDGIKQSNSNSGVDDAVFDTLNVWHVGHQRYSGTRYFNGLIDHVRIYNYARTPAQIAWDYNRGKPIAYWKFDKCSGETIYDQSDRCFSTGDCNHGNLIIGSGGSITATGTCASSSSSTFWGSGTAIKGKGTGSFDGNDDYVEINTSDFDLTLEYTISAWIYPHVTSGTGAGTGQTIYANYRDNNGIPYNGVALVMGGYLCSNGQQIKFYNNDNSQAVYPYIISKTAVPLNEWTHVVASLDSADNARIYINSILDQSGIFAEVADFANCTPKIGRGHNDGGESNPYEDFNGEIDEVKIWNYALTAEQVRTEYADGAVRFGD
jgi:hypothetical protein